jgi:fibronectin-binding autotransporter adhesin
MNIFSPRRSAAGRRGYAGAAWRPGRRLLAAALLAGTALSAAGPAYAADDQWTGITSKDWHTGSNWSLGVEPVSTDVATIDTMIPNPTELSSGTATVAGLDVGATAMGSLTVSNGATLNATGLTNLGRDNGSNGTLVVTGPGSAFSGTTTVIGVNGVGALTLAGGASVALNSLELGSNSTAVGFATISGTGTTLSVANDLVMGTSGAGYFNLSGGAQVTSGGGILGAGSGGNGAVAVSGTGTLWTNTNLLFVGAIGNGLLSVSNGGHVTVGPGGLGVGLSGAGEIIVSDAGSRIDATDVLIGFLGTGFVQLSYGGVLSVNGSGPAGSGILSIAFDPGSTGELNIGGTIGLAALPAGQLDATGISFGAGAGTLSFNIAGNTPYNLTQVLNGAGTIQLESGTVVVSGNAGAFIGVTNVAGAANNAVLIVSGVLGGDVNVATAPGGVGISSLQGAGSIGGNVTMGANSALIGLPGTTLNIGGSLAMSSATSLNVLLDAPGNGTAYFNVQGDLTLDGSLYATGTGNFGPGVYRLFDYGGTLTDNGLIVAGVPAGSTSDYTVQTSVANQVNLVYQMPGAGPNMFWDGGAPGNPANGQVDGGDGTWSATSPTFTNASGTANGPFSQPGFAVFQATPGTVTVDNSAGAIAISGIQFATSNYTLTGGQLTLADPATEFRLGDGSTNTYFAIVDTALVGSGGLNKTEIGRLILTGANTYTGGTTISAGILQIGNGGTTGSIVGDVVDNGVLVFNRSDAVTFAGTISGAGAVTNAGAGTLSFTGAQTYTGPTTISGGTLALVGAGALSASTRLTDNGTFDISAASGGRSVAGLSGNGTVTLGANTLTLANPQGEVFAGVIQGAGGLTLAPGTGTTAILTGANTYTGPTTVGSGSGLFLGNGGTSGSIASNVVLQDGSSELLFNRTDPVTFGQVISGAGRVTKLGPNDLTLTAANTYSGGTVVLEGRLIGNTTSLQGNIVDNATVIFNQTADGTYAGSLSGTGQFTKQGAARLNLTGDSSSYTGTTLVSAGLLSVNGSLAKSAVTVASGGTVGGTGTVGNLVIQSGATVSPGNSIGTLNVAGNVTFQNGATYAVEVDGVTHTADRIAATGTAALAGTVNVTTTGPFTLGDSYTILSAGGGISGTFSALTGTGQNNPFLTQSLSYSANAVSLVVGLNGSAFVGAATTPNQQAVAGALVTLPVTNPILVALAGGTAAQAAAGFDSLSGEIHAAVPARLFDDVRLVRDATQQRLRGEAGGVWGQGLGDWGRNEGNGNFASARHDTKGFIAGVDRATEAGAAVGAAFGYLDSDTRIAARASRASRSSYHLMVYGRAQLGPVTVRAGAGYGWGDLSTNRTITAASFAGTAHAGYRGTTMQGWIEAGHRVDAGAVALEPMAGLATVRLHRGGFVETGGAAALTGASATDTVNLATVGLRAETKGAGRVRADGMIGWRHAFGDTAGMANLALAGSAFQVAGIAIVDDAAVVQGRLSFAATPRLRIDASYSGMIGQHATHHALAGTLAWSF